MEREQLFSYEERFDVVLSYVYDHLDQPLDLVKLAEIAGMSPRHWHRIFAAAFGESLPALIKRVRLQRAVAMLADSVPVREVAERCGYPNVSSFTRAFRTAIGTTPAEYRTSGSHADLRVARVADDPRRYPVRETAIASVRCVAVRHRGSFPPSIERFTTFESGCSRMALLPMSARCMAPTSPIRRLPPSASWNRWRV